MNQNTEALHKMAKINDFHFSMNRELDWANIITSHQDSDRPSLWYLIKNNLKIYAFSN